MIMSKIRLNQIHRKHKLTFLFTFPGSWEDSVQWLNTLSWPPYSHPAPSVSFFTRDWKAKILSVTRTNNFTICMEIQKTSNSQSNLEKEEWNWRNQPAWPQTLLQSHSHQDSMVLSQRQKYRLMEQNRRPRDKSTNLWSPYLWQRRHGYTME